MRTPRVDEAHHRVSAQGFKYYVTVQVCWAAGGPQIYPGRTMLDSHRELLISGPEWDAFMDDFHQTLAELGVPERERGELDAIVGSTKDDIVTSPALATRSNRARSAHGRRPLPELCRGGGVHRGSN